MLTLPQKQKEKMPPKGKKPEPPSDDMYLFVNEDANTVLSNTRDSALDRSKQSHVQRRQFRLKRDEVANAVEAQFSTPFPTPTSVQGFGGLTLSSPQGAPGGLLSSSDYFNLFDPSTIGDDLLRSPSESSLYGSLLFDVPQSSSTFNIPPNQSPLQGADKQPAASSSISQTLHRSSRPSSRASRNERPTSRRHSRASSSIAASSTSTNQVDPFSNTFVALEKWAPPLIQYYTTVVIPHIFAAELKTIPMQLMRHTPALHNDMQTCMAEAAHMYALLAAVSATMLRCEGRLRLPDVPPEEYVRVPLYFKTKAITSLRQKLERGYLDHVLAHDVYRLMATAAMMDDHPAADAHFQALIEMVRGLGGLETFDDYVKEKMILLDIWRAGWTLSKPKFQLSWDPGYLPTEFRAEIRCEEYNFDLGTGFDHHETSTIFSIDFLQLVSGLAEVVDLACYSSANPLASNDFKWLLLRRTAIEYKLLSSFATSINEENAIAESTKLAMLIWIGMVLADRNKQLLSYQVNRLRNTLEPNRLDGFEADHPEVLLWIAVSGALATTDDEDKAWCTGLARRLAQKLEIDSMEDMEEQLHAFLYSPEVQRDALKALMEVWGDDEKGKEAADNPG
jgi:hypothetical protein